MDTPDRLSTLSFAFSVQPAVFPEPTPGRKPRKNGRAPRPLFPSHLSCVLTVDGKAYADELLDSSVFLAGTDLPRASFYLFTCGCGVPGCNGYFEEMVQTRADGRVVWDVPVEDGLAKALGGTRFVFDESTFEAAREKAVATILAHEAQGVHLASRLDHQGKAYGTFSESAARFRAWTQREAALQARIEAAIDPSLPRTLPSFDGEMPPHPEQVRDSDVGRLALIVLNCGRAPDPESYRDRLDALPALIALFQTFADGGDADRATQALLPYWRFMQKDGVHNPARPDVAFVLLPGPDGGPRPAVQHLF